ncbi:serine protease [Novipirellula maiorica]|uniref:serine protease n=1 Tax=Novipirellula maiorica TaxID=1265734 RepID=UPI001181B471|nr:serine protease [Rhodopirellula maiorica]
MSTLICLTFPSLASAQVQLDRFYPPVISVGNTVTVKAEGKFPKWPVKAVVDREDVEVVVEKDSGQLSVKLPADAAPGIAWIRLIDETSASKLVPILIEPSATLEEVEPNQKIAEATSVTLPAVVYGRVAKSNEIDTYRVQVTKGQAFVATTIAHRPLGSPMDAVMQLVDEQGNMIAQADDDRGIDPQLVYVADEDRELFVRIFAFPEVPTGTIGYAGSASFVYSIRMTNDAYVDHVLPLVLPADAVASDSKAFGWNLPPKYDLQQRVATPHSPLIAQISSTLGWQWQTSLPGDAVVIAETADNEFATASSLPCVFSGHISEPNDVDRLRFKSKASTRYKAVVHSRAFGFPLDSQLRVVNVADGVELSSNDDVSRGQYDSAIEFTAKDASELELQVSDLVDGHSIRHAYSVVISEATPTVELTVSEDHFAMNKDRTLEVPITISRKHGFDQELTITANGLPEGIKAEPVVSKVKGDTSTSVKLKLVADKTAAYQGSFRITARSAATDKSASATTYTATYALRDAINISDIWLSVPAVKD